jgi:hypothetical protein
VKRARPAPSRVNALSELALVAHDLAGEIGREPGQRPAPDLVVKTGRVREAHARDSRKQESKHGLILRARVAVGQRC